MKKKKLTVWKLIKKLDTIFSRYIRLKYSDKNWIWTCISCWKKQHWKQMHNAHWISRWKMMTRFDENNCRPACVWCNSFRPEFHIREFTIYQIKRLWQKKVDEMINNSYKLRRFKTYELEELIEHYKQGVKQLEEKKV